MTVYDVDGIVVRRFIFKYIDSNMYIIIEDGEALVIDPHIDDEATELLNSNGVKKITIIITHEHFDHTCGINWFRENYDTIVICQQNALDEKIMKLCCRPITVELVLADRGEEEKIKELREQYHGDPFIADITFDQEYEIHWKNHIIKLDHIPGHSPASILITLDDKAVFTGDSLIPDIETTLRWPYSNKKDYYNITVPKLLGIDDNCKVFPGHRMINIKGNLIYKYHRFISK